MSLPLPPKSIIRCDDATARFVYDQLTSVIAGHAQATTTYRFYEELDTWLGPWGPSGYPIGYGKFYNIAFTTNTRLMNNAQTRQWVWRTTILLQEALRDYVVRKIRDGSLPRLTEPELRRAAFDSHPDCYDRGGLDMAILTAPELAPIIATIPAREFLPTADNFGATIKQVLVTVRLIGPETLGNVLAAAAGPAHTGLFQRAIEMDRRRLMGEMALSRQLNGLQTAIQNGEVDYPPLLDEIIARVNRVEFPDQEFAFAARQLTQAAEQRKMLLSARYRNLLNQSPEVRARVLQAYPGLLR